MWVILLGEDIRFAEVIGPFDTATLAYEHGEKVYGDQMKTAWRVSMVQSSRVGYVL